MTITRRDSCAHCSKRITIKKDFFRPVDMFNPDSSSITKEMRDEIIAWRDEPVYCDEHAYIVAAVTTA